MLARAPVPSTRATARERPAERLRERLHESLREPLHEPLHERLHECHWGPGTQTYTKIDVRFHCSPEPTVCEQHHAFRKNADI